jgi:hypothetical protein
MKPHGKRKHVVKAESKYISYYARIYYGLMWLG